MTRRKQTPKDYASSEEYIKDFFDMVSPSAMKFYPDHFICGNTYRCVWAIREYPPVTTDMALLARFGDKECLTLHIYSREVDAAEQRKILQNTTRKNKMMSGSTDVQESITASGNLDDVTSLIEELRKNKEPLLHCAVFMELAASSYDKLKELQNDVQMDLTRNRITVDRLILRQKEGFISSMPSGYNAFGTEFERVLPASSTANLYPFSTNVPKTKQTQIYSSSGIAVKAKAICLSYFSQIFECQARP